MIIFSLEGGRGDKGTFHKLASSSNSSSRSSNSFSSSFAVFLLGVQELLRIGADFIEGRIFQSGARLRESIVALFDKVGVLKVAEGDGEGDRDLL